jgi:hypothetical protein
MTAGSRLLSAAGCLAFLSLTCGFAPNSSQHIAQDVIVTAAPSYAPLAALHGGERFPDGSQLLLIHNGAATLLLPDFAATADASVSFDASSLLFSGKKNAGDPWQIWELTIADRKLRQVTSSGSDAIRPFYLPGWRLVYAQRTAHGFQLQSARLLDSKALQEIEGTATEPVIPLTYINSSAIPSDVLADGRILFESEFPLGQGKPAELFLVYSDGSGVESYRCDHPSKTSDARWAGRQLRSGDVVFTHGSSLARFTSPLAHEVPVAAPRGQYAGAIAETESGEWLVTARYAAGSKFALRLWKPGSATLQTLLARDGENLVDPVLIAPRNLPRRHPSALHDWDYANLLALDVRTSRDGDLKSVPASVRLEAQDREGHVIAMGTAPLENDGSFFIKAPADGPIRFVLLDAKSNALRQEHGWFWIRRGEQRYCVGCHAGPEHAPENRLPKVLQRTTTPSDLTRGPQPTIPGGN